MLLVGILPEIFQNPPGPLNSIEALRQFISTPFIYFMISSVSAAVKKKEGLNGDREGETDVKNFFHTLKKDITQELCSRRCSSVENVLQAARRGRGKRGVPAAHLQANFSRLADPDVIHWTKSEVQDQRKSF